MSTITVNRKTTIPCCRRRPISWWAVTFLALVSLTIKFVHGEQQHHHERHHDAVTGHEEEHVHDEHCDHDDHAHDLPVTAHEDDDHVPHQEEEEEEHVHDEHCDHDHGTDHAAPVDGTTAAAVRPVGHDPHAGHDHSHHGGHSHDHSHGRPPRRPPPKLTPLMEAIQRDNHDAFVAHADDMNHFQAAWPRSALFYTFALRKYDFTEELLRRGVDVTKRTEDGVDALKLALRTVSDEDVKVRLVTLILPDEGDGEAALEEYGADDDTKRDYRELLATVATTGGRDAVGAATTHDTTTI